MSISSMTVPQFGKATFSDTTMRNYKKHYPHFKQDKDALKTYIENIEESPNSIPSWPKRVDYNIKKAIEEAPDSIKISIAPIFRQFGTVKQVIGSQIIAHYKNLYTALTPILNKPGKCELSNIQMFLASTSSANRKDEIATYNQELSGEQIELNSIAFGDKLAEFAEDIETINDTGNTSSNEIKKLKAKYQG